MIFDSLEVAPLGVNCFILGSETTKKCIVVDPGGDSDRIMAKIAEHNLQPELVINTHGHFDHVGANREVVQKYGAKLMIHREDAPMLQRVKEVSARYGIPAGENSPEPDAFLEDGHAITCGEISIKVIHTPGHTQGGVCLYIESEKKVITGDTLFADSIGRTDLPGGNHEQLINSIRTKLFTLPEDVTVYPGHAESSSIGYEKKNNPYF